VSYKAGSAAWTAKWSHVIGGNGAMYGYSVSLSGSSLAVGSPSDNFEFKNDQGTSVVSQMLMDVLVYVQNLE
jgi:hypothetical protein